jgi:hypothetical protein
MRSLLVLAPLTLILSCSSSSGDVHGDASTAALSPCDPLAPKPITLGDVVGVGQDTSGTLYVDSANGIFVSDVGNELVRQHVVGAGSSGTTEFLFSFEPPGADFSSARDLLVETAGTAATKMALGPTSSKAFLNQSPAGTTALTLADAVTVSGKTVVNTPNVISYLADVTNGDVILATVPMNEDETSLAGGLAIFYGPPTAVAQRTLMTFEQSLSGNGTLTFLVGDKPYTLAFGMVSAADAGLFGVFAILGLTPAGGTTLDVTLRSPTPVTLPTDLSFTCLH